VYGLILQLVFFGKGAEFMHQALYRKWRPKSFDDVCGQEHITSILKYEAEKNSFNHAYLFCGSRGTGKTTCAKILAKVVNCEHPVNGNPCGECDACRSIDEGSATDVLEMDAASNNSVENIRDIRDEVVYPPSALKYRVYIVDEVHMLSDSAFNALLKTLEEPPSYVIFILATTELHELPATIVSRCQRFEFRRISMDVLAGRLEAIAEKEGIQIEKGALHMLAKLAQGGMRDAISLLELCSGGRKDIVIDEARVLDIVGVSSRETLCCVAEAIAKKDFDTLFSIVDDIVQSSKDIKVFWQDLMSFYRDMLVIKTSGSAARYLDLTDSETAQLEKAAALFTRETILSHCKQIEGAWYAIQKGNEIKRTIAEMVLVKMCDESLSSSNESLLSRISKLEDAMVLGIPARPQEIKEDVAKPEEPTKPETKEQEAPKTVPEQKAEQAPAQTVMKHIPCWMEVLERVSQSGGHSASYLKQTKAYMSEDGEIRVFVPDSFTMLMVDTPDVRASVRASLSRCLGREVSEKQFHIELSKQALPEDDSDYIIDEILKKTQG
jgi:DNA polymerase-3 subunit gamma/tau